MYFQVGGCDCWDLVLGVKVEVEAKRDHWGRALLLLRRGPKVEFLYTLTLRDWHWKRNTVSHLRRSVWKGKRTGRGWC